MTPKLVDSHAHLDMPEFDADRPDVVRRAFAAGVEAILCPADLTRPESFAAIAGLAAGFPTVLAAAGVHAHQARDLSPGHLARVGELAANGSIRAVGEIGLDYHYDSSPPQAQREALRAQLAFAAGAGLPVILHSRLSMAEGRFVLPDSGISLDDLERDIIVQALKKTKHNRARAAKLLNITYDTLRYQVKKFGLE